MQIMKVILVDAEPTPRKVKAALSDLLSDPRRAEVWERCLNPGPSEFVQSRALVERFCAALFGAKEKREYHTVLLIVPIRSGPALTLTSEDVDSIMFAFNACIATTSADISFINACSSGHHIAAQLAAIAATLMQTIHMHVEGGRYER